MDYTVNGKYMQVKVPKSMLNISGYDFTVNFTWTDNVHDEADAGEHGDTEYKYTRFSGDIMDFYISGDVAPSGRFKFSYISTTENATGNTVEDETTEAPTETPTEPVTDTPQKGCKSTLGMGVAATLTAMAAAVALRKGKEN